jgi:GNAT superfamily N-acetyltransferase
MTKPLVDRLIVRGARPEDVDVIASFSAAMALETEGRILDRDRLRLGTLAVLQAPERGFFTVAEVRQEGAQPVIVGQLLVTYEWSDWRNAQFWWIQSVYVDPSWRRQGVYRRMHETIISQARARKDVCGVRLYVEDGNRVAQTVYQRVGLSRTAYAVFEEDFVLAKGVRATPAP